MEDYEVTKLVLKVINWAMTNQNKAYVQGHEIPIVVPSLEEYMSTPCSIYDTDIIEFETARQVCSPLGRDYTEYILNFFYPKNRMQSENDMMRLLKHTAINTYALLPPNTPHTHTSTAPSRRRWDSTREEMCRMW